MPATATEPRSSLLTLADLTAGESGYAQYLIANFARIGRFAFHLSVKDRDLATPPGTPTAGDCYIIAAGGTGPWAAMDKQIALWDGVAWVFGVPREGWRAWIEDEAVECVYQSNAWMPSLVMIDQSVSAATETHVYAHTARAIQGYRVMAAGVRSDDVTYSQVGQVAPDYRLEPAGAIRLRTLYASQVDGRDLAAEQYASAAVTVVDTTAYADLSAAWAVAVGEGFSASTISGVTITAAEGNNAGAGTLTYNPPALTWNPPGDPAALDSVDVSVGGNFIVSGTAGRLAVTVVAGSLPGGTTMSTITITHAHAPVLDGVTLTDGQMALIPSISPGIIRAGVAGSVYSLTLGASIDSIAEARQVTAGTHAGERWLYTATDGWHHDGAGADAGMLWSSGWLNLGGAPQSLAATWSPSTPATLYYLIEDDGDLKRFAAGAWTVVGDLTDTLNQAFFATHGFTDITGLDATALAGLTGPMRLLAWTAADDLLADITVTTIQDRLFTGDSASAAIDVGEAVTAVSTTTTVSGAGVVRVLVSADAGTTWRYWAGTAWTTVDTTDLDAVLAHAHTPAALAALSPAAWAALPGASIRLGYYLSMAALTDQAEVSAREIEITRAAEAIRPATIAEVEAAMTTTDCIVRYAGPATYRLVLHR